MLRALLVACVAVAAGGAAGGDATVSGVYLWRMRKAGSGSLQLLTEHYARAGHYFVVPNARTCVEIKFTARSSRHLLDTGRFESAVEVVFYLGGMALCPTLLVISNGWLIAC